MRARVGGRVLLAATWTLAVGAAMPAWAEKKPDKKANAALLKAAKEGNPAAVAQALKGKADIAAVALAASGGHLEVVQTLLAAGGDVNKPDSYGVTPVMEAALNGHALVVKALLEAKADLDPVDRRDRNVLLYAARGGSAAVVQELLAKGMNAASSDGEE